MKKTYTTPKNRPISITAPHQLLAGSNGGISSDGRSLSLPGGDVERRNASEAASRSSSDWDWED